QHCRVVAHRDDARKDDGPAAGYVRNGSKAAIKALAAGMGGKRAGQGIALFNSCSLIGNLASRCEFETQRDTLRSRRSLRWCQPRLHLPSRERRRRRFKSRQMLTRTAQLKRPIWPSEITTPWGL